ncbi:MAG: hypothetical protein KJ070_26840 [Verrucomicrobia bacterium]|nr:hypothetical protein [Verrucomicrobiota bacterium]
MNGYDNIDLISHSWGTTLTYDLQNVSGIAVRHWEWNSTRQPLQEAYQRK